MHINQQHLAEHLFEHTVENIYHLKKRDSQVVSVKKHTEAIQSIIHHEEEGKATLHQ